MATTTTEDYRAGDPTGSADPLGCCLAAIRGQLDSVVEVGAWSLRDAEVCNRLTEAWRVKAGVDELIARLVAAADERGVATDRGASSTQAWLAWTLKTSRGCAAGLLAQARAVSSRTEQTRRAWAAGDVSSEQAGVIAKAIDALSEDVDPQVFAQAEQILIDKAPDLTYPEFRILADHVIEVVDPDGADAKLAKQLEDEEARALVQTRFSRRRRGDGTSTLTARLPDLHADMLDKILDTLAAPRRAGAATAQTGAPTGTGAGSVFDVDGDHSDSETGVPTGAQRYGRAFCELIEHLLPSDGYAATNGAANATIVVNVDNDKLSTGVGEASLDTGTRISAAQARRLACNGAIIPMVLGGESRILDHGMSRRLFDRYQRLALTVRDRGCIWPGCDRPPAWCEAHHITAWSHGGPTDLANGCLLCNFHHHLLHKGEWAIRTAPYGIPTLIPPTRIDPHQRPLRHQRFTAMLN